MDILNWLYLRKNQLIRKTVSNPTADLVVLGADATFARRDDKYKTYAMTVEDFAAAVTLPPAYKVYTALLTQSGGDSPSYIENFTVVGVAQNIIKGVSYYIDVNTDNVDFSSIGAFSNAEGTYFIATENKVNTDFPDVTWGLGYNQGAPVVTVLENTIGNVWFSYTDIGNYIFNSNGLFTENKILSFVTPNYGNDYNIIGIGYGDINSGQITTINISNLTQASNGLLYNTPIEIRVYN